MNIFKIILTAFVLLVVCGSGHALQKQGGRVSETTRTAPKNSTPSPKSTRRINPTVKTVRPVPLASLSLNVTPFDSTIIMDGVKYRAVNGLFVVEGLTPKTYKIVVQRDGYQDEVRDISLGAGHNAPLGVSLRPLVGTLNVDPTVAGAEINIIKVETNGHVGTYSGRARDIGLSPGRYQILVSKDGYRTTSREVVVKPDKTLSIEPQLDLLPKPIPTPPRRVERSQPRFRPDSAMQVETSVTGKFIIVVLTGRSGDIANALGAIDVTVGVGGNQAGAASVSGMLTGYPCQFDIVRLSNVAEYSFVEPPGVANQWARAVVRVRAKESKRPVRFLINWKRLQNISADASPTN